jgi:hypothetical protein
VAHRPGFPTTSPMKRMLTWLTGAAPVCDQRA